MKVDDIRSVAVIGAGLMGHGIAQEFALAGLRVGLHDVSEEKLQQALASVQRNLELLVDIGLLSNAQADSVLPNLHTSTELKEVAAGADVVIEAVFEDLVVKQELFEALHHLCPSHTILASNTSSFMPSKLAAVTCRPDKVLITHYFNPPFLIPLVEVVRSDETSDETVGVIYDLMKKVGKSPAIVQHEVTGFIANRLQGALLQEALWIVQQGIATPEDVDVVIKSSIGRRWSVAGVFEVFDLAGWDTILAVFSQVFAALDPAPDVLPLLQQMVDRGELGPKSGQGFYEWTPESAETARQKVAQALAAISQWSFTS